MTRGRPLRFLGGVVAGWAGLRVAMLWPDAVPVSLVHAFPSQAATVGLPKPGDRASTSAIVSGVVLEPTPAGAKTLRPIASAGPPPAARESSERVAPVAPVPPEPSGLAAATGSDLPSQVGAGSAQPLSPVAPVSAPSRLTADAWLVVRPGGGDNLAFGQLGASQGGARLTYALDEGRRAALSARVSAPTRGSGRELGLGVDLRPTQLPVHVLVEQRIALDGGGSRPAAALIAGGSLALPARTRLDAYGQGGAVWKRGGFVDAAALVARPVLDRRGARVELGAGAWGAAQRRVSRVDIGPSAALIAPAGRATLRLQLDYRLRVAGEARPGSGPALSLGGSF